MLFIKIEKIKCRNDILENKEFETIYENGVFKPTTKVAIKNRTKAKIIIKPSSIATIGKKYRMKVETDVLNEFLEDRR